MQTVDYSNNDKHYSELFILIMAAPDYICRLKT